MFFFLRVSHYYCKRDQRLEKMCFNCKRDSYVFPVVFLHNGVRRFDEPYSKPTKTNELLILHFDGSK